MNQGPLESVSADKNIILKKWKMKMIAIMGDRIKSISELASMASMIMNNKKHMSIAAIDLSVLFAAFRFFSSSIFSQFPSSISLMPSVMGISSLGLFSLFSSPIAIKD